MKFKGSVEIGQSQKRVAELFADPANLKEYQDGFVRKELVSGVEGAEGAVSKRQFKEFAERQ